MEVTVSKICRNEDIVIVRRKARALIEVSFVIWSFACFCRVFELSVSNHGRQFACQAVGETRATITEHDVPTSTAHSSSSSPLPPSGPPSPTSSSSPFSHSVHDDCSGVTFQARYWECQLARFRSRVSNFAGLVVLHVHLEDAISARLRIDNRHQLLARFLSHSAWDFSSSQVAGSLLHHRNVVS